MHIASKDFPLTITIPFSTFCRPVHSYSFRFASFDLLRNFDEDSTCVAIFDLYYGLVDGYW